MQQEERERALSAVYALGVLAGQVDLRRLQRTLRAEHAEAKAAGVHSSERFMQLMEVIDAADWLSEAAKALAETLPPGPAPAAPPAAPLADQIPEDWAPATPR